MNLYFCKYIKNNETKYKILNFFSFEKKNSCLGAMAKKTLTTAQVVNVQTILTLPL